MVGNWEINVNTDGMPQKIATAFGKLNENFGTTYEPIAYLGSQLVNGTNHAVLAEQTVITGKDTKNIVLVIFNEKAGSMDDPIVVNIERVLESGAGLGGVVINVEKEGSINKTAQQLFDQTFGGFVGSVVKPIALLGTQIVRGTDFIFACEITPVIADPQACDKKVTLVTLNDMGATPSVADLLKGGVSEEATRSAQKQLRMSSPWCNFYKEVAAFFAKDAEVKVLFNNEEPELKLLVENEKKAAALSAIMPTAKKFGNVTLNISVVPANGETIEPAVDLNAAFEGNGAVSFIRSVENMFGDVLTYIVFQREVVSYFADNLADYYGAINTLYQDIAEDIFEETIGLAGTAFFSTDLETNTAMALGTPLGEWP